MENRSSLFNNKIVWLPIGLLPVFVLTAVFGAHILFVGFLFLACFGVGLSVALRFFFGERFPKISGWFGNVIAGGCSLVLLLSASRMDSFLSFIFLSKCGFDILLITFCICFIIAFFLLFVIGGGCLFIGMVQSVRKCTILGGQWLKKGGWLRRIAGVGLFLLMVSELLFLLSFFSYRLLRF